MRPRNFGARKAKRDSAGAGSKRRSSRLTTARLDEMVEEATVDCYNESEQVTGFFTMIEENLQLPFETTLLGFSVMVERLELDDGELIVAICRRGRARQAIGILGIPVPSPRPDGAEWIEAYRHWARWK
jgi:uncharacterized protein (UPF0262 family)